MENKKIKNATITEYKGINFRSKLEARVAQYLDEENVPYSYEKTKLTLIPSFYYEDKLYRAITYTPDFICFDYIIEVKGFPNDAWPIKKKLILRALKTAHIIGAASYKFREIHSIKELKEIIKEIKRKYEIN